MKVLLKEIVKNVALCDLIASNVSEEVKLNSIQRLRQGIQETEKKADIYFECPQVKQLTANEKRDLLVKTFQLGNKVFFNAEKHENSNFKHSYSLRYIKLDTQAVNAIESIEKRIVL